MNLVNQITHKIIVFLCDLVANVAEVGIHYSKCPTLIL